MDAHIHEPEQFDEFTGPIEATSVPHPAPHQGPCPDSGRDRAPADDSQGGESVREGREAGDRGGVPVDQAPRSVDDFPWPERVYQVLGNHPDGTLKILEYTDGGDHSPGRRWYRCKEDPNWPLALTRKRIVEQVNLGVTRADAAVRTLRQKQYALDDLLKDIQMLRDFLKSQGIKA